MSSSLPLTQPKAAKSARPALAWLLTGRDEPPIGTAIVAPMTTKGRDYPTRIPVTFKRKQGLIVLDQIRTWTKPASSNCSANSTNQPPFRC
jgi:mRNA interferase MazF